MAKTKAAGATKLGRDSLPKYLGIKLTHRELTKPGQVLVRQRGTKYVAGKNVAVGSDDTLYAKKAGKVIFQKKRKQRFDGSKRIATVVNVEPLE